jgi:hypothetical protein
MLRLERLGFALFLWASFVVAAFVAARSGQDQDMISVLVVLLLLALVFTASVLPRLVYWGVDQKGIHQRCLGVRLWDLPWSAIESRSLGLIKQRRVWLVNLILPILLGPYQALRLKNRARGARRL